MRSLLDLMCFSEAHERFMRETHFTEGETEPRVLVYNITKCPELKNPLNPDEGTTGYTLFGLHEVYRGPEGCAAHMASAGQAREALLQNSSTWYKPTWSAACWQHL